MPVKHVGDELCLHLQVLLWQEIEAQAAIRIKMEGDIDKDERNRKMTGQVSASLDSHLRASFAMHSG